MRALPSFAQKNKNITSTGPTTNHELQAKDICPSKLKLKCVQSSSNISCGGIGTCHSIASAAASSGVHCTLQPAKEQRAIAAENKSGIGRDTQA